MKLKGEVVGTETLSDADKGRMLELMSEHFDGMSPANFHKDLSEKPWTITLRDRETGRIEGFSTMVILDTEVEGRKVKGLFSGDTIINRDYWGENSLSSTWLKFVFDLMEKNPGILLYWFLISQGYRTYSYFTVYFKTYYPKHDTPFPPFEKKVLDTLAEMKFPGEYNPETGIIRFKIPKDRLKPELSEISERRLRHPDVKFFVEKNPGHREGDELACLAPLTRENFKRIALRVLDWKDS